MKKPEILILLVAALATAAKLYCAFTTVGSADVYFFHQFGRVISDQGVVKIYEDPIFNHPPLLGTFLGFAYDWASGKPDKFASYMRLPGIIADLLAIIVLLWIRRKTGRPPWWALALFAASPVSFMVSGYHGNFDPLIALGVLLTVAACVADQPMVCGLFLGLSCQVKIIPALMGPAFFFYWLYRGKAAQFAIGAVCIVAAGWLVPLLSVPGLFLKRVIAYNSIWGWWGVSYLVELMGGPARHTSWAAAPSSTEVALTLALKALIVSGVIALAWRKRSDRAENLFSTLALSWAIFFVLAPGFGVQYLVWIGPFLLMHSERWFVAYTAAASIALFEFYNAISHGMPWNTGFTVSTTIGQWRPWLLLPWGVLLAFLAASMGKLCVFPKSEDVGDPVPASVGSIETTP